jgi:2-amino-4-hydroxy-6-hydroxymethyldihydropteridine diphosphokinase
MILIALGANLPSPVGEPVVTMRAALENLAQRGIKVEYLSPFYRTLAWPDRNDPPFVNAVANVLTQLEPGPLLAALQDVERKFGRTPKVLNAPRTLDLDIIDYEGRIERGPPELPHPRVIARAFVLVPLADVAPHWHHPVSRCTVSELIAALPKDEEMPRKLAF